MSDTPPPPLPARRVWWRRLQRLPLSMMVASVLAALGIVQLSFQLGHLAYRSVVWSAQTRETLDRVALLEGDVRVLKDAIQAASDPAYLEQLARCEGYVGKTEQVIVSSTAPVRPPAPGTICKALRLP
ncbi:cell division protein FtsB [Deinococcus sp. HMF7620]|uniref:Cell division protein FtsB n=1 Tax=Deinococcus arboris TaxID=2682977 RepID=A0A7C9I4U4_9DEIO|nr:cell division protein FtsB [Deinococcus arboris]MVN88451.1 cell division protein FtsB [Deinococcus arboris]